MKRGKSSYRGQKTDEEIIAEDPILASIAER
jgi:hypothetical protein